MLASYRFESWAIVDHESGTLQRHEAPALEFAERAAYRFPSRADAFRNLLVREAQVDRLSFCDAFQVSGTVQKETS